MGKTQVKIKRRTVAVPSTASQVEHLLTAPNDVVLMSVAEEVVLPTDDSLRQRMQDEIRGELSTNYVLQIAGAYCPRCHCKRTRVRTTRPPEAGLRVRYHVCPICKVRFKSLELV